MKKLVREEAGKAAREWLADKERGGFLDLFEDMLCRTSAANGDASAQYTLGHMYYNGNGVPQDYQEAAKWHRLAAKQGESYAQYMLGVMCISGNSAPQDAQKAMKWFRLAAEQGQTSAQFNLGVGYAKGQGSKPTSGLTWLLHERLPGKLGTTNQGETDWQRRWRLQSPKLSAWRGNGNRRPGSN